MSSFPEWAKPWLVSQSTQVSHGLNLVLELKAPEIKLPLLLWDIVLAQDKIKQALEGLSFVHYARFIPSWDGRALMVTTEFDGDLDPYVLDFVIALGDVFDTLMSYVKAPPPTPVRENPDEFLAWVRKWNRVPFSLRSCATLFPEDFDYPVYSAYSLKTVTDIAGQRDVLPPPAIDHPASAVDLSDVQGNILRGYRAKLGCYLFFSISDAAVARKWMADVLPQPNTPWMGIASAMPWAGNAPDVLTQVALTHEGLARLLLPGRRDDLDHFPIAFKDGAEKRADANFDRGDSAPAEWIFGRANQAVHVVLFLYTKVSPAPLAYQTAVTALTTGQAKGLKFLMALNADWNQGREPFGFADGVSDPPISGQCPPSEPAFQPAASPGEFLLHKDYATIYGGSSLGQMPQRLAGNGTFGVLRLMEQDVAGFKSATDAEALALGVAPDLLRAKMVGRWDDGSPLALFPTQANPAGPRNAFDYAPSWEFPKQVNDHEGLRCPVGAHIRRANPRTARVAGQRHSRRLLRRGMPVQWPDKNGVNRVGLMGLFLGASIERQFEFIQRQWLQGDLAASGIRGTTDPIAGIRAEATKFSFNQENPANPSFPPITKTARIPPLVKTRGCLYLFFPGLKALSALDDTDALLASIIESLQASVKAAEAFSSSGGDARTPVASDAADTVAADGAADAMEYFFETNAAGSAMADAAKAAILQAEAVLPGAVSHWPGVPGEVLLGAWGDLDSLLKVEALQGLADGHWQDIVRDLVRLKLDSPWVKQVIAAFVPTSTAGTPPPGIDVADLDLSDPSFRADPFAALAALRRASKAIVWVPAQQACWVLSYQGCQDLLSRQKDFLQVPAGTPLRGIVTLDEPRHTVVSKAYAAAFRSALDCITGVNPVGTSKLDTIVEAHVAPLKAQTDLRQFDFMKAFAHPVARSVFWELMGVPDSAERIACDALADRLVLNYGREIQPGATRSLIAADAGLRLAAHLSVPLSRAVAASLLPNSPPQGSLIGELAARIGPVLVPVPGRPLGFMETLMTLVQTVLASQSPHFLLGSAALHLLPPDPRFPPGTPSPWETLSALVGSPAFDQALDEVRRYEPPLTLIERYAAGTQTIAGQQVPDGCAVFAMVGSGNRDEAKFGPQAEEFHYDRPLLTPGHLSLGHGIHECAGRELQRLLVTKALGAMIQAMPTLRLSNPTAAPAWRDTIYFRVLQALSVTRCPP